MAVNAVGVWMTRADNMSEEEDEDNLRVIDAACAESGDGCPVCPAGSKTLAGTFVEVMGNYDAVGI